MLLPAYAGLLMERASPRSGTSSSRRRVRSRDRRRGQGERHRLEVIDHLLTKVDMLVLGGGMANTFLLAQGKAIGKSLAEPDRVADARRILATAEKSGVRIVLPIDVIVAKEVTRGTEYKTLQAEKIPASWHIVDLGKASQDLMLEALRDVKTVFWNCAAGRVRDPSFAHGTNAVARMLAEAAEHGATVVVGGGDSVAAITQAGPRRQDDPHLDRRWRVARVPRGPRAARRDRCDPHAKADAKWPKGQDRAKPKPGDACVTTIDFIDAREILDSRGNPTVEVDVVLADGSVGRAAVPSGASTGAHEAVELRDGDTARYGGKGVLEAVAQRQRADRAGARSGCDATDQARHRRACSSSSTGRRTRASSAPTPSSACRWPCAHAAAASLGLPLYRYLGGADARTLPVPMFNILNGGKHAAGLDRLPGVHGHAGRRARPSARRCAPAPRSSRPARRSSTTRVTPPAGRRGRLRAVACRPTRPPSRSSCGRSRRPATGRASDVAIALDPATTELVEEGAAPTAATRYVLAKEGRTLERGELIDLWADWAARYPIVSHRGRPGRGRLGRLAAPDRAPRRHASSSSATTCSSPTPSGSRAASRRARQLHPHQAQPDRHADRDDRGDRDGARRRLVGGHLATAPARPRTRPSPTSSSRRAPGQIKTGAPSRTERVAKYNRLLRIEGELGDGAVYPGRRRCPACRVCPVRARGCGVRRRVVTRFVDRGAITAAYVGIGMAIASPSASCSSSRSSRSSGCSPCRPACSSATTPTSDRTGGAGPWRRILVNGLFAGARDRPDPGRPARSA